MLRESQFDSVITGGTSSGKLFSCAWVILPGDDFRFNFNNTTCTVNVYYQNC